MRNIAHHRYTWTQYLGLERTSNVKHEFFDGEIFAMAGGTPQHSQLAVNVVSELRSQLRGQPCVVYNSDLLVRVLATGLATYPDASVVCGELRTDPESKNTAVNPTVLVEVLSPSTEDYDRGDKFEHVRQIPSLRHYVLVSDREPLIEVFSRGDGSWSRVEARRGSVAALPAINCLLSVDGVYEDVVLES